MNYKVVDLLEIYTFSFGHFSIQTRSNNSKYFNFKLRELFEHVDNILNKFEFRTKKSNI